jgi:toxin YoeB
VVKYSLRVSKQAQKDSKKLKSSGLQQKAEELVDLILENPYNPYPKYEKLGGDLKNAYSRRINAQHRLVYEVLEEEKIVKILRMWTHYE